MASPRAAFCALLGVSAAFLGCTATLDFAALSAGDDRVDGGRARADASVNTGLHDAARPPFVEAPQGSDGAGRTVPDIEVVRDTGRAPDAGSRAPDDASAADAGLPAQAVRDAGAADPSSFDCLKVNPPATFCDDFETPGPLQPKWDETYASPVPGGSIGRDTTAARAGMGSMLASLAPHLTQDDAFNEVWATKAFRGFAGLRARYVVEFDLRVEQVDPLAKLQLNLFQFLLGSKVDGFTVLSLLLASSEAGKPLVSFLEQEFVADDPATPEVEASPASPPHPFSPVPNLNEWAHVTFVLDANEPSGFDNRASLTVGNTLLYGGPLFFALREYEPTIDLGLPTLLGTITQVEPGTAWRVRYDNVLVRVELK
jgi:hypothetical protein